MKKKIIAMFLVLVMAVCIFPVSAFADDSNFDEVGFYGTKSGRPGTYYYSYFTNKSYWVGWNFSTSGNSVKMVQAYLYMDGQFNSLSAIDGFFGNNTETAIRGYQYNHNLSQDGVVGTSSWRDMGYYRYGVSIAPLLA